VARHPFFFFMKHKKRIFPRLLGQKRPRKKRELEMVEEPPQVVVRDAFEPEEETFNPVWDTQILDRPELSDFQIPAPIETSNHIHENAGQGTVQHSNALLTRGEQQQTAVAEPTPPYVQPNRLETPNKDNLDDIVDQLLRDKDFLLAKELKHKADEINQLMIQAQRQNLKVEVVATQIEASPGKQLSWLDVKIFKEI
jgi:hypothetical protein